MNSIVIDFGGTNIKLALVEKDVITASALIPAYSENGLAPRLGDTEAAIRQLARKRERRLSEFDGIGVAMPGIVNPKLKRVTAIYNKYEDSLHMDLENWCRERFNLEMVMEMDSKSALLGELNYGCGRGFKDAVMIILGTGVGTAVAINGELLTSRNYQAGALGSHISVEVDGRKCTCPNSGCLEANASGWALEHIVREHSCFLDSGLKDETVIDFKVMKKWVDRGDQTAKDVMDHFISVWRTGIVNLIHAYDPELIILSGGVMNYGDDIFNRISQQINKRIWKSCGKVKIRLAENPNESVLLGLNYLVQKELAPKRGA